MRLVKLLPLLLLALVTQARADPGDVAGSADHPAVTRYPGAVIKWHTVENYLPYKVAVGPVTGYRQIGDWIETEGRLTRIYYEVAGQKTHAEIFANYEKALADGGFEIVASGLEIDRNVGKNPGGRGWLEVYFAENIIQEQSGIVHLLQGSSTSGGSAFVAGKKARAEGTIYVAVTVTQYSSDIAAVLVDVIEEKAAETDLITVNAEAMGKDIDELGRVVLDGLFFDHDKATLTAQSKPALDEIARFLTMRPELSVFVVGHTDASGTFAYNEQLSRDRAAAVAAALVDGYGIAAERLEAHGVGPLVPVFTNTSDAGKTKNRRVELVKR